MPSIVLLCIFQMQAVYKICSTDTASSLGCIYLIKIADAQVSLVHFFYEQYTTAVEVALLK